jgi:hypothetical protein
MKRNFIGSKGAMRRGCLRVTIIHNFFHRIANEKRKQTMFSLMDGEVQVVGIDNILKHAS